jgi:hypothetical protein
MVIALLFPTALSALLSWTAAKTLVAWLGYDTRAERIATSGLPAATTGGPIDSVSSHVSVLVSSPMPLVVSVTLTPFYKQQMGEASAVQWQCKGRWLTTWGIARHSPGVPVAQAASCDSSQQTKEVCNLIPDSSSNYFARAAIRLLSHTLQCELALASMAEKG